MDFSKEDMEDFARAVREGRAIYEAEQAGAPREVIAKMEREAFGMELQQAGIEVKVIKGGKHID